MGCEQCEIVVLLDGGTRHVTLLFENLEKLAWSDERNCFLYQCRTCRTLWESCAYEKAASEIAIDNARPAYPGADIRD